MARYIGLKSKIARKFGEPIFGPDKVLSKKITLRVCTAAIVAGKPQNTGYSYVKNKKQNTLTVLERQFRKTFERAARSKGITGEVLLQLLESRLDNLVYRLGLAPLATLPVSWLYIVTLS